jgi:CheY-specific phosphatase CheX
MIEEAAVHQLLSVSAQKVLEAMFFVTPDKVSMDPQRPAGELIAASLTFQGAPPGRFGLVVSDLVARTLAANFIGCDDGQHLHPAQVSGVMGELANMMCGAAISELESNAIFDLSAPESTHVGADEPGPDFIAGSPPTCRFEFPEGALVFSLTFEEPV